MEAVSKRVITEVKELVRRYSGTDISGYKDDFLYRRIRARMLALNLRSLNDYVTYLRRNPKEVKELLNNISINVSEFFRDPWVWEEVKKILIKVIESKKPLRTLRLWSAGCSKGEEPYTISIILHELLGPKIRNYLITIYATDIDHEALEEASKGVYRINSLRNVPPQLRMKYFEKVGPGLYMVKPEIKQYVKFRRHDLIRDPPLPFMDMVFCRNVLIYFSKELQNKVLLKLWRSLRVGGYLVLGASEYLTGEVVNYFKPVSIRARIFVKTS